MLNMEEGWITDWLHDKNSKSKGLGKSENKNKAGRGETVRKERKCETRRKEILWKKE